MEITATDRPHHGLQVLPVLLHTATLFAAALTVWQLRDERDRPLRAARAVALVVLWLAQVEIVLLVAYGWFAGFSMI